MRTILLDAGHGGMIGGQYQTDGKKWTLRDGTTIHEGEFNRAIKARVMERLYSANIPYIDINPEQLDVPRWERVKRANKAHRQCKQQTLLLSIHANIGGGKGTGFEVFTSKKAGKTSRLFASICKQEFDDFFPQEVNRGIKRKNFDLVYQTKGPAALLELFFMDREREARKYIIDPKGRDYLADYIVACIQCFLNTIPA